MENLSKNIELSAEEEKLIHDVDHKINIIEEFLDNDDGLDLEGMVELNRLLNESYKSFLPRLDTENLKQYYNVLSTVINLADHDLVSYFCAYVEDFVGVEESHSSTQIPSWKNAVQILRTQMIPRLKEEGLLDILKELERKIMFWEIVIASGEDEKHSI